MSRMGITCIAASVVAFAVDGRVDPSYAMRGTGFEPADPYGTAPSTLRRWPGLATHARMGFLVRTQPLTGVFEMAFLFPAVDHVT